MGGAARPFNRSGSLLGLFPDGHREPPGRHPYSAPWKTNEDRQSLLQGPYNDELIEAAAGMIAEMLPQLSTADRPCPAPGCGCRAATSEAIPNKSIFFASAFSLISMDVRLSLTKMVNCEASGISHIPRRGSRTARTRSL